MTNRTMRSSRIKVKEDPSSTTSSKENKPKKKTASGTAPGPSKVIKNEPLSVSEESDDDEDDELSQPDPSQRKNYKRIRQQSESDTDSNEGESKNIKGQKRGVKFRRLHPDVLLSDSDDEYVPLFNSSSPRSGSTPSGSEEKGNDGDESDEDNDQISPELNNGSPKRQVRRKPKSPTSRDPPKKRKKGGCNGFLADECDAEKDEVSGSGSSSSASNSSRSKSSPKKRYTTRGATQKLKEKKIAKTTPKKKHRNRDSSSDTDYSDMFELKLNPKKERKPKKNSESSESESSKRPTRNRPQELSHTVVRAVKSIIPGAVGVSSKSPSGNRRRRKSQSSGSGRPSSGSDDSFIDHKPEPNWNLESSSSSDEKEEEKEDSSNLDLNSDNYESASSSSTEISEESSPCSSDSEKKIKRKEELEAALYKDLDQCCIMCDNLGFTNFKNREDKMYSTEWCKCDECEIASGHKMGNYDRICCREIKGVLDFMEKEEMKNGSCITSHPAFKTYVLRCRSLLKNRKGKGPTEKSIEGFKKEFKKYTDSEKTEKCREAFLKWIFGRSNLHTIMVVPACVVACIRKKWTPTAADLYFDPFKTKILCKTGTHCHNANPRYLTIRQFVPNRSDEDDSDDD